MERLTAVLGKYRMAPPLTPEDLEGMLGQPPTADVIEQLVAELVFVRLALEQELHKAERDDLLTR